MPKISKSKADSYNIVLKKSLDETLFKLGVDKFKAFSILESDDIEGELTSFCEICEGLNLITPISFPGGRKEVYEFKRDKIKTFLKKRRIHKV